MNLGYLQSRFIPLTSFIRITHQMLDHSNTDNTIYDIRDPLYWDKESLYQEMDRLGYDAVTLTDFCRRGSGEAGRYRYEEDIREPEHVNWWGVGPGGISVLWDRI
jgi:hypothetical protein